MILNRNVFTNIKKNNEQPKSYYTNYKKINNICDGFTSGIHCLGGCAGVGKTTFMLQLALDMIM